MKSRTGHIRGSPSTAVVPAPAEMSTVLAGGATTQRLGMTQEMAAMFEPDPTATKTAQPVVVNHGELVDKVDFFDPAVMQRPAFGRIHT